MTARRKVVDEEYYEGQLLAIRRGATLMGPAHREASVDQAIARFGGEWLEHAPVATRNYVRSIVGAVTVGAR